MEYSTQTRLRGRLSWMCAILLLLMSSAQAMHVCGLEEGLRPRPGTTVQIGNLRSGDGFCAICASSHSPSLAAPLVYLPSLDGLTESSFHGRVVRRSALQIFALYTRPPPSSQERSLF
jgi:hypothetical protein